MLRGPISNIRLFQFSYVILVSVCIIGSILLLSINYVILPISTQIDPGSTFLTEHSVYDRAKAGIFGPLSFFDNPLLALFPLMIGLFIIAFYIPNWSSLGLTRVQVQKEYRLNRFHLPVRGYTIPIDNAHIRVTRKFSSIRGLLLREMNFTVYLPLDYSDKKRLFDFLVGEKINFSERYVLFHKTVDIRNIPLLIVRTRAILASTTA